MPKRKLHYKVEDQLFNWTVVAPVPAINGRATRWLCRCVCGTTKSLEQSSMKQGNTKSCGCLRSKLISDRNIKHGKSEAPLYSVWNGMIQRCSNPKSEKYHRYGGRGIKVCDRWLDFKNFLADMGDPPSLNYSLNRINNDGNYEPENCVWSTMSEQARNRSSNHLIIIDEEIKPLIEWCEFFKVPYSRARSRLRRGWSPKDALLIPKLTSKVPLKKK